GIGRNEGVDREAKKVTEGEERNQNSHFGILKEILPNSKSVHKQWPQDKSKEQWKKQFQEGPRYHRLSAIDKSMPSNKYWKTTVGWPKRNVNVLTQLQMQHAPLQAYLHKIKKVNTPMCQQCKEGLEMVIHYLIFCKKFDKHRQKLQKDTREGRGLDMGILGEKKSLLGVFRYINNTK
ncbi:hypothetical protein BYT27DRAFT_7272596, partial [Phlegmacium glaucopus]